MSLMTCMCSMAHLYQNLMSNIHRTREGLKEAILCDFTGLANCADALLTDTVFYDVPTAIHAFECDLKMPPMLSVLRVGTTLLRPRYFPFRGPPCFITVV